MSIGSAISASNVSSAGGGASTQLLRDQQRLAVDTNAQAGATRLSADKQAVTRDRRAVSRNTGARLDRYA